jgi:hypothetical protein
MCDNNGNNDGGDKIQFNSIQFNSIRVYLRANLTAQRPSTKLVLVYRSTQK